MFMRLLSRICSFFAAWLLRNDWHNLRKIISNWYPESEDNRYNPPILAQQLLILGEDHRFFKHGGIDLIAICRAIWKCIAMGRREGASTIEMQIVRVATGKFEPTLGRKIKEMALATLLTRIVPKELLPSLYLRISYYGWRMNGFREACLRLGISADSLAPSEVANLVARLKYPQPKHASPHRWDQINAREKHLMHLYLRHGSSKTFLHLNSPIVNTYEAV
jgi:penicillin-binding protein 1A